MKSFRLENSGFQTDIMIIILISRSTKHYKMLGTFLDFLDYAHLILRSYLSHSRIIQPSSVLSSSFVPINDGSDALSGTLISY